jgi:starch-binding outer membrane protein, SusD/RagB family
MKIYIKIIAILVCSAAVFVGCTDLEEDVFEIRNQAVLEDDSASDGLLASAYNSLRPLYSDRAGLISTNDVAADDAIVPVRGNDWFDGGRYIELQEHSWSPGSVSPRQVWDRLNEGLSRSLTAIFALSTSEVAGAEASMAEARALATFYMYQIMDHFGQVPYRDPLVFDLTEDPVIMNSSEALAFIIGELNAVMPLLKSKSELGTHGRMTQDAAKALLARIYLNKGVYEDRYGTHAFSSGDMDQVIGLSNEIIAGPYSLEDTDFFRLFDAGNDDHPEIIFAADQREDFNLSNQVLAFVGMGRRQYIAPGISGWNGFCTLTDFVDTWDETDPRFYKEVVPQNASTTSWPVATYGQNRGLQEGQQYGPTKDFDLNGSGDLIIEPVLEDRSGEPMNYTREVQQNGGTNWAGVRVFKYEYTYNGESRNERVADWDIPIFRLADIYLMRAEAKLRKGDDAGALADVNFLRDKRGAATLGSIDLDGMLNERGFEFYWEMQRRVDQIRFGKWGDAWTAKPASDPTRRVYPIPQTAMDSYDGLMSQNEGY